MTGSASLLQTGWQRLDLPEAFSAVLDLTVDKELGTTLMDQNNFLHILPFLPNTFLSLRVKLLKRP